ncbi:MAG: ParB/RepB/Spo0J family partition protein [bacterium]|nr:ParB/RepB/Spo0J family partition protein [bacterium]
MAKNALGKGLSALMGMDNPDAQLQNETAASDKLGVVELELEQILQNPLQPRRKFDENKLQELADSIKVHGVVQPVIVNKVPEGYRLVVGERRFRASKLAGLSHIPAIVRDFADQQMLEVALIENLQREDLNPIETAQAYQYLLKEHNLTHDQLSERLGCSRSAVSNTLRLLALPDEIREDVISGVISSGHARAILSLDEERLRFKAWQIIKTDNLSVRQAEKLVAQLAQNTSQSAEKRDSQPALSPEWQETIELLREKLNADVRLSPKAKGKGRLEFYYHSQKELESLLEMLFYMGRR